MRYLLPHNLRRWDADGPHAQANLTPNLDRNGIEAFHELRGNHDLLLLEPQLNFEPILSNTIPSDASENSSMLVRRTRDEEAVHPLLIDDDLVEGRVNYFPSVDVPGDVRGWASNAPCFHSSTLPPLENHVLWNFEELGSELERILLVQLLHGEETARHNRPKLILEQDCVVARVRLEHVLDFQLGDVLSVCDCDSIRLVDPHSVLEPSYDRISFVFHCEDGSGPFNQFRVPGFLDEFGWGCGD